MKIKNRKNCQVKYNFNLIEGAFLKYEKTYSEDERNTLKTMLSGAKSILFSLGSDCNDLTKNEKRFRKSIESLKNR